FPPDRGPRVEKKLRDVPVVDPSEEDQRPILRDSRGPAPGGAIPPCGAPGHAERNHGEKFLESRVLRKVRRADAARFEEGSGVEETLFRRGAEKEVGPREGEMEGCPIVPGRLFP